MKRLLGLFLALAFALPQPASADTISVTWGTSGAATAASNTTSTVYPAASFKRCYAQITSSGVSVTNVLIEGATDSAFTKVQILGTITNPSNTGEYWGGACPAFLRFETQSYVSGTLSVVAERREPTP